MSCFADTEIILNDRKEEDMKLQHVTDIEGFVNVIRDCKGKVELVTGEGDRLNLKSRLCQYVAFDKLFSDENIGELEVIAAEPEDVTSIVDFLMER